MQAFELWILDLLQQLHNGPADAALTFFTRLGDKGAFWLALAAVLLARRRTRRAGLAVLLALALDLVCCNLALKPLIGRLRPFAVNPAVRLLISPPGDPSFPSGHTASSFAAAAALRFTGGTDFRLRRAALALAVLIAFSRLYLYVHWPTDVLAGAALGIGFGWCGAWLAGAAGRRQKQG